MSMARLSPFSCRHCASLLSPLRLSSFSAVSKLLHLHASLSTASQGASFSSWETSVGFRTPFISEASWHFQVRSFSSSTRCEFVSSISDVVKDSSRASDVTVPLSERPASSVVYLQDVVRWRKKAQELASAVGSQFMDADGGPDVSDLLRELDWLLDDSVAACATGLTKLQINSDRWSACSWRDIKAFTPSQADCDPSIEGYNDREELVGMSTAFGAFSTMCRDRYTDPVNEFAADCACSCDGIRENLAEMAASDESSKESRQRRLPTNSPKFEILMNLSPTTASPTRGIQLLLRISIDDLDTAWKDRIQSRRPFQYMVGCAHWRDLVLIVQEGVLIPRPETEQLIDLAEAAIAADKTIGEGTWVDLGTGSGAIAIALAKALSSSGSVLAVDASSTAVSVAGSNIKRYLLQDRITVLQGFWFGPLQDHTGKLAGVISNPPYIPSGRLEELQAEVGKHEPKIALDGGLDGMNNLRLICKGSAIALRTGGFLALETNGREQAEYIASFLSDLRVIKNLESRIPANCFQNVTLSKDCFGVQRFVTATCC